MTTCIECGKKFESLGKHLAYSDCTPVPSYKQREILRGILMGDAWVGTSGRCIQSEWKSEEYAKYISKELGWVCGDVKERSNRDNIYQISTVSCDYIEDNFSSWYDSGKKKWNLDIELSDIALSNLYACDGHLKAYGDSSPAAIICCSNESVRLGEIADWIAESGFPKPTPHYSDGSDRLYFPTDDTPKLLNMIDSVDGYEYKWEL